MQPQQLVQWVELAQLAQRLESSLSHRPGSLLGVLSVVLLVALQVSQHLPASRGLPSTSAFLVCAQRITGTKMQETIGSPR